MGFFSFGKNKSEDKKLDYKDITDLNGNKIDEIGANRLGICHDTIQSMIKGLQELDATITPVTIKNVDDWRVTAQNTIAEIKRRKFIEEVIHAAYNPEHTSYDKMAYSFEKCVNDFNHVIESSTKNGFYLATCCSSVERQLADITMPKGTNYSESFYRNSFSAMNEYLAVREFQNKGYTIRYLTSSSYKYTISKWFIILKSDIPRSLMFANEDTERNFNNSLPVNEEYYNAIKKRVRILQETYPELVSPRMRIYDA